MTAPARPRTVHLTSLGCAKNRVDSEVLLGLLRRAGYEPVTEPREADLVVVNTCGFIQAAKEESLDAVLEAAELKRTGRCQTLLVTGCLVQRHPGELAAELPEVDKFLGSANLGEVVAFLASDARTAAAPRASFLYDHTYDREPSLGRHTAYVKVAEGCDRPCAFCAVPGIRGPQQSRTPDSVLAEVEHLVAGGVVEVNLVAQDLTAYGRDLGLRPGLPRLIEDLRQVSGLRWLRLLYAYPSEVDDALLAALAAGPPVVPYLDVPVQHVDDVVLRAMKRGYSGALVRALPARLREAVPGIRLRTTFLVGHPGETEAAFAALLAHVGEAAYDHAGGFAFSPEAGTAAIDLPDPVDAKVAARRADRLMRRQRQVSRQALRQWLGRSLTVLVEGRSPESDLLGVGRHAGQAPEVDGVVHLADLPGDVSAGTFVTARVEQTTDYDLVARFEACLA
jgi:ribosomal protein S12 methylthiotransferase